jgi:type IV pilus assembly protein PilN
MQRPENVYLLKETADLNQLFDAKALSWTLVMEDLETVLPAGVQVTGIDPTRAKDGSVTLHIRVRGPRDRGIDLVKNLELSNCFRSPRIVAETADSNTTAGSATDQAGVPQATEFDVLADYNPDATDHFSAALASAAPNESGTSGSQGKAATRASRSTHIGFPKSKPDAAAHIGGRK